MMFILVGKSFLRVYIYVLMEPHKTHTDNGWVIRICLRIRHCALKDSQLNTATDKVFG